jgi:AcrR family transcriptional regulator
VESARAALLDRIAGLIERGLLEGSIRRYHSRTVANVVLGTVERYVSADARARIGDQAMSALAARVAEVYRVGILGDRSRLARPSFSIERGEELSSTAAARDPELARFDEIIRTATRHFNAEGERASIPRIAAELGVSKTVIYQYALDKQDLLFQCYARAARVVEMSHRIASDRGRDALDEMLIHRENLYRYHASAAGPFALLTSMDFLKPQHLRRMRLSNRRVRLTSQERMKRAIEQGFVRAGVDPAVVQPLFGEALYGLPYWYTSRYPLSIEEVCRQTGLVHFVGLAH